MKCLVTGAAGFIGSEITRELIKKGYQVRAFILDNEDQKNLAGLNIEIMRGDVRDSEALKKAMAEIDYVFHTASMYEIAYFYVRHPKDLYDINVEGTKNVCQAALEAKVKKLIYTGTTGSIGCVKNQPTDEASEFNMLDTRSHYEKSKALGEKTALSFHEKGLWVVSINPSFLVGPRDSRPSPTGEIVIKFLNRRYPVYFDAPLCLSELHGTVEAHVNALESGKSGQRYIVASDYYLTIKTFFEILEKISGIKKPPFSVPLSFLKVFGIINESLIGLIRLCGVRKKLRPLISYDLARYFSQGCLYNPAKAKRELHFAPEPIEKAIRESVDWYIRNGYIKKSSCETYFKNQAKYNNPLN